MGKVLCFGELLLRISPDGGGHWLAENKLPFFIGGAEANTAAALALWDVPVSFLSALPDNYFAKEIAEHLNSRGVDVSKIHYSGDRLGLYYLAQDKDLKSAGVIYDRANSSFADLARGDLDWDILLRDVEWLHFSAICPAINQAAADVCEEMLIAASAKGIRISLDLNYRAKLWKNGRSPLEVMPALAKYCDVIMGNIWAANEMLGIPLETNIAQNADKGLFLGQSKQTSQAILKAFPNCKMVANTFRFEDGTGIKYYTTLQSGGKFYTSKEYRSARVINKIGSGDCFMAGLIYGSLKVLTPQETLEFGTAAAFLKLFVESDFSNAGIEDIYETMKKHE